MRAAVTGALGEAEVRLLAEVVDTLGRERPDALGQSFRVVGHGDLPRDLVFREFRRVQHVGLILDQRPLEGLLRTVDVDALAVLARGVEQRPDDARREIAVAELHVRRLHGEG